MKHNIAFYCSIAAFLIFISCNNNASTPKEDVATNMDSASAASNWKIGVQLWTFRLFTQEEAWQRQTVQG